MSGRVHKTQHARPGCKNRLTQEVLTAVEGVETTSTTSHAQTIGHRHNASSSIHGRPRFVCAGHGPAAGCADAGGAARGQGGAVPPAHALHGAVRVRLHGVQSPAALRRPLRGLRRRPTVLGALHSRLQPRHAHGVRRRARRHGRNGDAAPHRLQADPRRQERPPGPRPRGRRAEGEDSIPLLDARCSKSSVSYPQNEHKVATKL